MTQFRAVAIIEEVAGIAPGTLVYTDKLDTLSMDSLEYLLVIQRLEEESGMELPPEMLGSRSFETVGGLTLWFAAVSCLP